MGITLKRSGKVSNILMWLLFSCSQNFMGCLKALKITNSSLCHEISIWWLSAAAVDLFNKKVIFLICKVTLFIQESVNMALQYFVFDMWLWMYVVTHVSQTCLVGHSPFLEMVSLLQFWKSVWFEFCIVQFCAFTKKIRKYRGLALKHCRWNRVLSWFKSWLIWWNSK